MRISKIVRNLKFIVLSVSMLVAANVASADGWTNWFNISKLGNGLSGSEWSFYIYPDGGGQDINSCGASDYYAASNYNVNNSQVEGTNVRDNLLKLASLAYTAGWQVRIYAQGCNGTRNAFWLIEVQKP